MTLRSVLFWIHLVAGVIAGLVIAVMCFTGVALAFEKQIIAFAERDLIRVAPPGPDAPRLSLDELARRVRAQFPNVPAQLGITVAADPGQAVVFNAGRGRNLYANPYTGAVSEQGAKGTRDFLRTMEDWHRWLGARDDTRPMGKAITGACNAAFLVLAMTGLFLWWPRSWKAAALRPSVWFVGRLRGRARDWNWHNVIGLWCAPILIVLTLSGVVISYRWASNLVFTATGTTPPPPGGAPGPVEVARPAPDAQALGLDALFAAARAQVAQWETITLRFAAANPRDGERLPAVTAAIRQPGNWPLFSVPTWQLDPFTGAVLKRESFTDFNAGRRARTWLRFLHTGEALGLPGQFVAGVATLGGLFLVWTGYALAIRRWRRRKTKAAVAEGVVAEAAT